MPDLCDPPESHLQGRDRVPAVLAEGLAPRAPREELRAWLCLTLRAPCMDLSRASHNRSRGSLSGRSRLSTALSTDERALPYQSSSNWLLPVKEGRGFRGYTASCSVTPSRNLHRAIQPRPCQNSASAPRGPVARSERFDPRIRLYGAGRARGGNASIQCAAPLSGARSRLGTGGPSPKPARCMLLLRAVRQSWRCRQRCSILSTARISNPVRSDSDLPQGSSSCDRKRIDSARRSPCATASRLIPHSS